MSRKIGILAATMLAIGSLGLIGCGSADSGDSDLLRQQTVVIQVENDEGFGVSNVMVRAWIVDVDLPTARREPIEIGTAPTANDGTVRFTHLATLQPYICGYEIEEVVSKDMVAMHAPDVLDRLSGPAGQLVVRLD